MSSPCFDESKISREIETKKYPWTKKQSSSIWKDHPLTQPLEERTKTNRCQGERENPPCQQISPVRFVNQRGYYFIRTTSYPVATGTRQNATTESRRHKGWLCLKRKWKKEMHADPLNWGEFTFQNFISVVNNLWSIPSYLTSIDTTERTFIIVK